MQESVCTGCGAINRLSADVCWRCLQLLDVSSREVAADAPEPDRVPAATA
jgi:hypothetical protein